MRYLVRRTSSSRDLSLQKTGGYNWQHLPDTRDYIFWYAQETRYASNIARLLRDAEDVAADGHEYQ